MPVSCAKCKQPIQSKAELLVMRQWGIFVQPLHKACWGTIASQFGGVGSISYGTGVFQKKQSHIPVNSGLYWLIGIVLFLLGIFIFTQDISNSVTQNGQTVTLDLASQLLIKIAILIVLSIPLLQRLWSATCYESQLA